MPLSVTSEPSVPEQQNWPLTSFTFPPDVPSFTAPACALSFCGASVTVAVPIADGFACDIAVIITLATFTAPEPSEAVGTPPGATYKPALEINPLVWLPPVTPFTCQVTAVFDEPMTVAVKFCVVKLEIFAVVGDTVTLTTCVPPPEGSFTPLQPAKATEKTEMPISPCLRRMRWPPALLTR